MDRIAEMINGAMTAIFNLICLPFRPLHPIWSMIFISFIAGVVMVWIFGKVSNQKEIGLIRNRISGFLIGVRLFRNDPRVVFSLQGRILKDTLRYMRHSVFPMLALIAPVLAIMIQLNLNFGVQPLQLGKSAILKVKVRDGNSMGQFVELRAPEGVEIQTPPLRIKSERVIAWRIGAKTDGRHKVEIRMGEETHEKLVVAGKRWDAVPSVRTGQGWRRLLLWPGEPAIGPSSSVESISVNYADLPLRLFGFNIHWMVWFFVLSIIFGFAVKDWLGVKL